MWGCSRDTSCLSSGSRLMSKSQRVLVGESTEGTWS
ncbi:rCG44803, partial [Rattus norvegicus]